MRDLEFAATWAMRCAAVPACALAWRRREHRPIAALILFACLCDVGLRALREDVILPAQAAVRARGGDPLVDPLTGWTRAAGHLYQAVWIGWGPAVAAAAASVFGRRRGPWLAALLWVVTVLVLVLGYHQLRGYAAKPVYLASDLAALMLGISAVADWARRRRSPHAEHVAALTCVGFQAPALLAYYRCGPWGASWDLARIALVGMFLSLTLVEGGALCTPTSTSRSGSS